MRRFHIIALSFSSLLLWQCGLKTDIAANYYDDGIYLNLGIDGFIKNDKLILKSNDPKSTSLSILAY